VAGIRWQLAATMQVNCCFCFPFLLILHRLVVVLLLHAYHQFTEQYCLWLQPGTSGCNQEPLAATRNHSYRKLASINLSTRNISSKNVSSRNVSSRNQVPGGIGIAHAGRLIVVFSFLEPPCLTVVSVFSPPPCKMQSKRRPLIVAFILLSHRSEARRCEARRRWKQGGVRSKEASEARRHWNVRRHQNTRRHLLR